VGVADGASAASAAAVSTQNSPPPAAGPPCTILSSSAASSKSYTCTSFSNLAIASASKRQTCPVPQLPSANGG